MTQNHYHIFITNKNTVKAQKSCAASTEPDATLTGQFNQGNRIDSRIQGIIKNSADLKDERIQKVGEALFDALFDNQLREDFLSFYTEIVKKRKQILQVILEIKGTIPEILAYPWELMCLPAKYNQGDIHFATDWKLSFFRRLEENLKLPIQINPAEKLKIALVISKPTADSSLNDVEYQGVTKYLNSLDKDKVIFLPVMDSLDFSHIVDKLEEDKPDVFHFIGHGRLIEKNGEYIGQIAFVNDAGAANWKDAKMFSELFSGHTPKIVILQACETGKQSETNAFSSVASHLIQQGVPVVIAMQYEVSNQTATSFVTEFYSRIIKGHSVEVAVQKARFKLAIDYGYKQKDFAIPVLYMNALDGYLFSNQSSTPPKPPSIIWNDQKKQHLIKILQEVFTEEEIKTICMNHQTQLKGNPFAAIPGDTVNARFIYLVDYLIRRGLIDDFLNILCQQEEYFASKVLSL